MPDWIEHFRRQDLIQPLSHGQEDGPLEYLGKYEEALGIPVVELPIEEYCVMGKGSDPFGDVR